MSTDKVGLEGINMPACGEAVRVETKLNLNREERGVEGEDCLPADRQSDEGRHATMGHRRGENEAESMEKGGDTDASIGSGSSSET